MELAVPVHFFQQNFRYYKILWVKVATVYYYVNQLERCTFYQSFFVLFSPLFLLSIKETCSKTLSLVYFFPVQSNTRMTRFLKRHGRLQKSHQFVS